MKEKTDGNDKSYHIIINDAWSLFKITYFYPQFNMPILIMDFINLN
jgi:hypothetical protein